MRKIVVTLTRTYSVPDEVTDQEVWDVLELNEGETLIDGNEDFHWAEDPLGKVTCDQLTISMYAKCKTFRARKSSSTRSKGEVMNTEGVKIMKQATPSQIKQAAELGEKLGALLDEAEQEDIDFRLIRSIIKDSMERIEETIIEREAKDSR